MEKEKALDVIKRQIDCYSNEEDKCFAVRACGDCKYNATVEEIIEALQIAISALEKQKPVKVDSEWDRYYGKNNPCCGACGAYVDEYSKYCKHCGRPIDWGD